MILKHHHFIFFSSFTSLLAFFVTTIYDTVDLSLFMVNIE